MWLSCVVGGGGLLAAYLQRIFETEEIVAKSNDKMDTFIERWKPFFGSAWIHSIVIYSELRYKCISKMWPIVRCLQHATKLGHIVVDKRMGRGEGEGHVFRVMIKSNCLMSVKVGEK